MSKHFGGTKMAVSEKWRLSRLEYEFDLAAVPVLLMALLWGRPIMFSEIVAGLFAWSLLEYVLHRFLFHRLFRKDHWAHHVDPSAYIGISGIYIGVACAVFVWPARWLNLESFYAGFLLGYAFYLVIHYLFHRADLELGRIYAFLARNHVAHHRTGIAKNFGVTSPLWDWAFSTYTRTNLDVETSHQENPHEHQP